MQECRHKSMNLKYGFMPISIHTTLSVCPHFVIHVNICVSGVAARDALGGQSSRGGTEDQHCPSPTLNHLHFTALIADPQPLWSLK